MSCQAAIGCRRVPVERGHLLVQDDIPDSHGRCTAMHLGSTVACLR